MGRTLRSFGGSVLGRTSNLYLVGTHGDAGTLLVDSSLGHYGGVEPEALREGPGVGDLDGQVLVVVGEPEHLLSLPLSSQRFSRFGILWNWRVWAQADRKPQHIVGGGGDVRFPGLVGDQLAALF